MWQVWIRGSILQDRAEVCLTHLVRCAKSGSDWTKNELAAYNANIIQQTAHEFFGASPPSGLSAIDPALIKGDPATIGEDVSDEIYRILKLSDLATKGNTGIDSAKDDFAREIFRIMKNEDREYGLSL